MLWFPGAVSWFFLPIHFRCLQKLNGTGWLCRKLCRGGLGEFLERDGLVWCRIFARFSILLGFVRIFACELQFHWKTSSGIFFRRFVFRFREITYAKNCVFACVHKEIDNALFHLTSFFYCCIIYAFYLHTFSVVISGEQSCCWTCCNGFKERWSCGDMGS